MTIAPPPSVETSPLVRRHLLFVIALLLIAIGVRIADLPSRYESRDIDEMPYTIGGLQLLEGLTPGYKYSPAGPLTWTIWAYAGLHAVDYVIHPPAEQKSLPVQVRPFFAVDKALFEQYRDLSVARAVLVIESELVSILAVAAAFYYGVKFGGVAGGVLLGGLFAVAPFIVWYGGQARPFDEAWSMVMIAAYFAACCRGRVAFWGSALSMGFAISSRIDMFPLAVFLWPDVAEIAPRWAGKALRIARHSAITLITTLLLAPWLVTNLIGNLRTIFTVRFSPPSGGPISVAAALTDFGWHEGMAAAALLLVVGVLCGLVRRRLQRPLLCLLTLLLLTTVAKADGHGIGHQGVAVIALLLMLPMGYAALRLKRWWSGGVVAVVLLAPTIILAQRICEHRRNLVPEMATDWVESHVPAGSIVYLPPTFKDPLPTLAASDAIWEEVTAIDAPAKKFGSALTRFKLSVNQMPRALSEENMIVERIDRRRWYILGSAVESNERRFDTRLYDESATFGIKDPIAAFRKTGGTLIWRDGAPAPGLGEPLIKWTNPAGYGAYIYCSADVKARLSS